MDKIFEAIEEWMRNLLTGMVSSNLTNMFTDVNEKTGDHSLPDILQNFIEIMADPVVSFSFIYYFQWQKR